MTDLVEKVATSIATYFGENDSPLDAARAALFTLSAIEAAGGVIVPRVPSEAMELAGGDALSGAQWANNAYESDAHDCYTAMIEASQTPPA